MRGLVTLRQLYCHRGRRSFQSERYRIIDLNPKSRALASPIAWLASLAGTSLHRPDAGIYCPAPTTIISTWGRRDLRRGLEGQSADPGFIKTKGFWRTCSNIDWLA